MNVDPLHGLPVCDGGYISGRAIPWNPRYVTCNEITKWHGKHKPYACDFPSELIKR